MKQRLLCACIIASALLLRGDDDPTLDVVAGWMWDPYPYYYHDHPYRYGCDPYWRYAPYVGVGAPLYRWPDYPYGYGYNGYGYWPVWGYASGMRIHLKERRYAPVLSETVLPPFPGSAPTELRDPKREREWQRDIEALLSPGISAPTNAAPQLLTAPYPR